MRGSDERTGSLFSYVGIEGRLRPDHPLRAVRALTDETLAAMERDLAALYSEIGRPSIAPQMLLRAMLLQAFYSVRSERQLMERMEFDLLFRWFVGLGADEPVWDASTFSKNRDRLLEGDVAARFLATLMARPRVKRLLSSDHFSVDGTMIQAWSSMKSVRPIEPGKGSGDEPPPSSGGRNAETDFRGTTRTNATHASTTDPEAKLYRKGAGMEARLAFLGHALMENRCGRERGVFCPQGRSGPTQVASAFLTFCSIPSSLEASSCNLLRRLVDAQLEPIKQRVVVVFDKRVDQTGKLTRGGFFHLAGDGKGAKILGCQRLR